MQLESLLGVHQIILIKNTHDDASMKREFDCDKIILRMYNFYEHRLLCHATLASVFGAKKKVLRTRNSKFEYLPLFFSLIRSTNCFLFSWSSKQLHFVHFFVLFIFNNVMRGRATEIFSD